ncbi:hypothetical protein EN784_29495 [bacterium M00.F.Ca.ET.141.01.1.1]|nr:hypothetical protein EN784_29495 [bacterium M00.F.Ca.ET.141.01.1.1]
MASVRAAPHLPAGILSPYSDGERGATVADFANLKRCRKTTGVAAGPLSPSLYGEMSGRTVRGGADAKDCCIRPETHDIVTQQE